MRDSLNIRDVESLNPDMMGFMFWPESKRYVSCKPDYLPDLQRVDSVKTSSSAKTSSAPLSFNKRFVAKRV